MEAAAAGYPNSEFYCSFLNAPQDVEAEIGENARS
jgi:hypothetical protein